MKRVDVAHGSRSRWHRPRPPVPSSSLRRSSTTASSESTSFPAMCKCRLANLVRDIFVSGKCRPAVREYPTVRPDGNGQSPARGPPLQQGRPPDRTSHGSVAAGASSTCSGSSLSAGPRDGVKEMASGSTSSITPGHGWSTHKWIGGAVEDPVVFRWTRRTRLDILEWPNGKHERPDERLLA